MISVASASTLSGCFGYGIVSSLDFRYLRPGGLDTPLDIVETPDRQRDAGETLVLDWPARADNPLGARLYQSERGYRLSIDQVGQYWIDPNRAAVAVAGIRDWWRAEASLWGLPLVLCFLQRGDLSVHAAAVDVDGSAVLLAGPGRHGKTTLAGAFLQAGHRVLAEDISCCRISTTPVLLPGAALLRLRRDTYGRLDLPGTTVVGEDPDRLYLAFDEVRKGSGLPVPIKAIVLLGTEEEVSLSRLSVAESLRQLWALTFQLPTDTYRASCFQGLATLASHVDVWSLKRPLSFTNLPAVVQRVISTCVRG